MNIHLPCLLLLLLLLSRFSLVRLCGTHRRQPTRLPIPGILQARTPEWVAISFSNAWKWKGKVKSLSCVRLLPCLHMFKSNKSREQIIKYKGVPSSHLGKKKTFVITWKPIIRLNFPDPWESYMKARGLETVGFRHSSQFPGLLCCTPPGTMPSCPQHPSLLAEHQPRPGSATRSPRSPHTCCGPREWIAQAPGEQLQERGLCRFQKPAWDYLCKDSGPRVPRARSRRWWWWRWCELLRG